VPKCLRRDRLHADGNEEQKNVLTIDPAVTRIDNKKSEDRSGCNEDRATQEESRRIGTAVTSATKKKQTDPAVTRIEFKRVTRRIRRIDPAVTRIE